MFASFLFHLFLLLSLLFLAFFSLWVYFAFFLIFSGENFDFWYFKPFFSTLVMKAINFTQSMVLLHPTHFNMLCFHYHLFETFLNFSCDSSVTHGLFRGVLFNFQIFEGIFWIFYCYWLLLSICCLFCPETILCKIPIFWSLLQIMFWSCHVNLPFLLHKK